jgi:hypothetical protein
LRDFGLADGGANVQAQARRASNGGWDVEMVHATITSHFRGTLFREKANLLSIKHLHGTDQWPWVGSTAFYFGLDDTPSHFGLRVFVQQFNYHGERNHQSSDLLT